MIFFSILMEKTIYYLFIIYLSDAEREEILFPASSQNFEFDRL